MKRGSADSWAIVEIAIETISAFDAAKEFSENNSEQRG
jgi:hypothetical protein